MRVNALTRPPRLSEAISRLNVGIRKRGAGGANSAVTCFAATRSVGPRRRAGKGIPGQANLVACLRSLDARLSFLDSRIWSLVSELSSRDCRLSSLVSRLSSLISRLWSLIRECRHSRSVRPVTLSPCHLVPPRPSISLSLRPSFPLPPFPTVTPAT